jgi:hypothetical protein
VYWHSRRKIRRGGVTGGGIAAPPERRIKMTKDEAIGMLTYLLTRYKNAYGTLPNNLEHLPDEFRKPYALVRKALTDYELATAIHAFFTRKPVVNENLDLDVDVHGKLSFSLDDPYETGTKRVFMLFMPDERSDEHFHLELTRQQAVTLYEWLNKYITKLYHWSNQ